MASTQVPPVKTQIDPPKANQTPNVGMPTNGNAGASAPARKYQLATFPKDLLTVDRTICHDHTEYGGAFSYLVLPDKNEQEGLFPRGELNLIAGASGSWKTTVLLQFIWNWKNGEKFFGRRTCQGNGKYVIVSFDRSDNGFARTAVRMGFDPNSFHIVQLHESDLDRDPRRIIEDIVNQFGDLQFLLIEGIDLKAGDIDVVAKDGTTRKMAGGISDAHAVSKMMLGLRSLASKRHFALIASVGSPKQKSSDKYTSKRDQIIGSQAWARLSETVAHLGQVGEDEADDSERTLSFLPRNGKNEVLQITLDQDRRPVRAPEKPQVQDGEPVWKKILAWIQSDKGPKPGQTFTVPEVRAFLPDLKPDTIKKELARMVTYPKNRLEKLDRGVYRRMESDLKNLDPEAEKYF